MMNKRLKPILDDSAWKGKQLQETSSWSIVLSTKEQQELAHTTEEYLRYHKIPQPMSHLEFTLPLLSQKLRKVYSELTRGKGFVLIKGLPIDRQPIEFVKTLFFGVASYLGYPVSQNIKGERITHVCDSIANKDSENVRGYLSSAALPFHCDSPDVVVLLCLMPAPIGGLNSIVSSMTIYNKLLKYYPEFLDIYYKGFHYDRRNEHACDEALVTSRVPIFSYYRRDLSCRYLRGFIEAAQKKSNTELSRQEIKALDCFDEIAQSPGLPLEFSMESGDLQIVNNYTVLHSRTEFSNCDNSEKTRHLLRQWLKVPDIRNLDRNFVTYENGLSRRDGIYSLNHSTST